MPTGWRRRRLIRQLAGLYEPGETLVLAEHLRLGGWWVLSDRSLYVLRRRDERSRIPLREVRSVRVTPGRTTSQVTVISVTGDAVVGDLRPNGALVDRLRSLPTS